MRVALVEGAAALHRRVLGAARGAGLRARERSILSSVEDLLVLELHLGRGVAEEAVSLLLGVNFDVDRLQVLWLAQALVEHHLVVVDQVHLTLEPRVVVVLCNLEVVDLFLLTRWGKTLARSLRNAVTGWVLPKLVVEGALAVASSMQRPEATIALGDVGIAACTVVGVHDWFGVDVGQWLSWSCLLRHELT